MKEEGRKNKPDESSNVEKMREEDRRDETSGVNLTRRIMKAWRKVALQNRIHRRKIKSEVIAIIIFK